MPSRPATNPGPVSDLYTRIRFDPALESLAFRLLAEWDIDGARAAFGRLVDQLVLENDPDGRRATSFLLHDVVQRVNRRLHHPTHDSAAYQATRVEISEHFASCEDVETARRAFAKRLNALLSSAHASRSSVHPLIQRTQAYVEEHYQNRIGLARIAKALHVSPSYLSRLFRKETGSTLTAYIHRVRLEHARLLLGAGARSISEIAFLVGYQTYRDFYRNFVKYENASHRQARRSIRSAGNLSTAAPGDST
jgi:AraC-like DNA-binding protein